MTVVNAAQAAVKTVADPNASYESLKAIWDKSRAVCSGERFVKDYDGIVDTLSFNNLLIPFSPSMSQQQYNFYKAEAELPGITAQFSKMIVGGLLRKTPVLTLPDNIAEDVHNWIMNEFGKDDCSLSAFLDDALWEEIQTSRAWVFVDYPKLVNPDSLTPEEFLQYKPYPILHKAENIINWRTRENTFGKTLLDRIIVRGMKESFVKNEFHPTFIETVWVHELNEQGFYQIRIYQRLAEATDVPVVSGQQKQRTDKVPFELVELIPNIMANGKNLDFIPAWPLNGSINALQPVLLPIIDKEVALYNKLSRRNHLLYGAATYTPVISSDMGDEDFDKIVASGLGTWLKLRQGDTATVLETPTAALQDMDRAIAASIEEMAKLGIRMLTPETDQSGVALEIRNAAQTAQLGSLNNRISNTVKQIITFMINWRTDAKLKISDVEFSLSADFNAVPLGADWLRLATEWYQQGLIPRSVWLEILKHNDMIPPDYDDAEGQQEIVENLDLVNAVQNDAYATEVATQTEAQKKTDTQKQTNKGN